MAAPANEYAFDPTEAKAAAERWAARSQRHEGFAHAARCKKYSELDTPERRAKRANRLLERLGDVAPQVAEELAGKFVEATAHEIAAANVSPENIDDELLERVIGETRDFQFIEFLEHAIHVSKTVGRVVVKLGGGRASFGTGFMVSPRLMMTNHHVLDSAETAAASSIEFNYQRDRAGQPLAVRNFKLDPATFFLNDRELDFALVALAGRGGAGWSEFGWCPLIREEGKIVIGEAINIIQHPKGEMKQIILRENRLIDLLELHAHYEADTEPGSSGSPVFNDQWEVVALHHSGVPKMNEQGQLLRVDGQLWRQGTDPPELLDWVANEGIRVSRLVDFISRARVQGTEARRLVRQLLDAEAPRLGEQLAMKPPGRGTRLSTPVLAAQPEPENPPPASEAPAGQASVTLSVPLQVTISVSLAGAAPTALSPATNGAPHELEKIEPDPDDPGYERRGGYDPCFLGFEAPFPRLAASARQQAFQLPGIAGDGKYELKYHHFSLMLNKQRRLAFAAGVNYDPTAPVQHPRDKDGDRWFFDPRVSASGEFQAGGAVYASNPLDRGHLVRRADAGWGYSRKEAKLANDDTFHFTNCAPQHAVTNQGRSGEAPEGLILWGKLEDYIAAQGKSLKRKLSIFNGPVFRPSDRLYRGVRLPEEFWKLVLFARDDGSPGAVAFLLTQAELLRDLREEFDVGEYKAVQVRIRDLEAQVHLSFGPFRGWDVLEQERAEEGLADGDISIVLSRPGDILL